MAALCWPRGSDAVDFGSALLEQAVRAELDMPEGAVTLKDLERDCPQGTRAFEIREG